MTTLILPLHAQAQVAVSLPSLAFALTLRVSTDCINSSLLTACLVPSDHLLLSNDLFHLLSFSVFIEMLNLGLQSLLMEEALKSPSSPQ